MSGVDTDRAGAVLLAGVARRLVCFLSKIDRLAGGVFPAGLQKDKLIALRVALRVSL